MRQFLRQHFGRLDKTLGATPGGPAPKPLTAYQTTPLPSAPVKWQPFRLLNWGLYGNARWGDCVFAAAAHCWMALARLSKQKWSLSSDEVIAAYRAYCARYNNGQDNGSIPQVVLQNWHTQGMWGTTLPAWAPIDHTNPEEVRQVLASYGCLMVCVNLPKPAYTYQMGANYVRFKIPVWHLTGTPDDDVIIAGHEIAAIGYDSNYVYCVTWGVVVRLTHAWWDKYVIESDALVVPTIVTTGKFNGLDIASLEADLATLK